MFDLVRNSIELFDGDGDFERRVQLNRQLWGVKGFLVLPGGDFLLSGALVGEDGNLFHFGGEDGRLIDIRSAYQGDVTDSRARRNVLGGVLASDPAGGFFLSLNTPLRVLHFSSLKTEPTVVFEDPERVPFIGDGMIEESSNPARALRYRWFYPQTTGLVILDDGNLLNVVTMREEDRSLWQVFDRGGSLLAERIVEVPYRVWAHSGSGEVLATRWPRETQEQRTVRLRVSVRD